MRRTLALPPRTFAKTPSFGLGQTGGGPLKSPPSPDVRARTPNFRLDPNIQGLCPAKTPAPDFGPALIQLRSEEPRSRAARGARRNARPTQSPAVDAATNGTVGPRADIAPTDSADHLKLSLHPQRFPGRAPNQEPETDAGVSLPLPSCSGKTRSEVSGICRETHAQG